MNDLEPIKQRVAALRESRSTSPALLGFLAHDCEALVAEVERLTKLVQHYEAFTERIEAKVDKMNRQIEAAGY